MLRRTVVAQFTKRSPVLLEQEGWREHISYVKYLNICTTSLHKVLKDKPAAKYQRFSNPGYMAQEPDGSGSFRPIVKVPATVQEYSQ